MTGITAYASGIKLSPLETDTAQAPYLSPSTCAARGSRLLAFPPPDRL